MRAVIWFVLLFVVAVVAATTLGSNDGLVSFYWGGWRTGPVAATCSCSLLLVTCAVLMAAARPVNQSLIGLPQRAREWRVAAARPRGAGRAARGAGGVLRRPLQPRAQGGAARAGDPERHRRSCARTTSSRVLGHLLAAGSLHRLQDRARRDAARCARCERKAQRWLRHAAGGGRAPARRRVGARRPRRAARSNCWPNCRPAWRAARRRCGCSCRPRACAAAAGGAADGAPAGQAPGLLDQRRRRACCARWPSRRSTPRAMPTQLRRVWLQLDPADRRDATWPRAPHGAPPASARARRRPRLAAPVLGPHRRARRRRTRHASRWRLLQAAPRACATDWLPRLESAARACPTTRPWLLAVGTRVRRAPAVGQGAAPARAGGRRRHAVPAPARRRPGARWPALPQQEGDAAARAAACEHAAAAHRLSAPRRSRCYTARLARL